MGEMARRVHTVFDKECTRDKKELITFAGGRIQIVNKPKKKEEYARELMQPWPVKTGGSSWRPWLRSA